MVLEGAETLLPTQVWITTCAPGPWRPATTRRGGDWRERARRREGGLEGEGGGEGGGDRMRC